MLLFSVVFAFNVCFVVYGHILHHTVLIVAFLRWFYIFIRATYYSAPVGERSIAISLSVCVRLSASISLEPLDRSSRNFCADVWLWLGPPVAALRYVIYFRFMDDIKWPYWAVWRCLASGVVVDHPTATNRLCLKVLMAFLLQVGNHARRKYQHGPRSQTNLFAIAAFDLQGQILRSKGQIRSFFSWFQKWSTTDVLSDRDEKNA